MGDQPDDEAYFSSLLVTDFNDHGAYSSPRMVGVTVAWQMHQG